jgi:hypothetical protein
MEILKWETKSVPRTIEFARDKVSRFSYRLAFRGQNDAIEFFRVTLEIIWSANMIAAIGSGSSYDLALRHGYPGPIDLDLIVSIGTPARRWAAIGHVATRAFAVRSL